MNNKDFNIQFDAIIAKNIIARQIRDLSKVYPLPKDYLLENLKRIEKFTGQSNQPGVEDILLSDGWDL